eukprot:RCo013588
MSSVSFLPCPPPLSVAEARRVFCEGHPRVVGPRRAITAGSYSPTPGLTLALRILSVNPSLGICSADCSGVSTDSTTLFVNQRLGHAPQVPDCLPALWQLCFGAPHHIPSSADPFFLDLLSTIEGARVHRRGVLRHPGAFPAWLRRSHRTQYSVPANVA